jgi:hypothetical protein
MYDKIIDSIYDSDIKSFTYEAVDTLPSHYSNITIPTDNGQKNVKDYTGELHSVVKSMLLELDVDDIIYDMFTVAVLLQFAGRFEMVGGELMESTLYPFEVRGMLKDFEVVIGRDLYHDIMTIIEAQMGLKSPLPQIAPQINEPVLMWILPLANSIVRSHNI